MNEQRSATATTRAGPGEGRSVRYVGAAGLPDGTRRLALGSGVITALLSKGGSAFVYEIWNSQLEVCRAVKLLHPDKLEESKERFETEVKISAKLHHPNIVEIYVVGNWNGLPYIEMERIDGTTLEHLVAKRGAIPVQVCTAIGIMVSRALEYAHNQRYMIFGKECRGIIHRDLKPGNVMLGREGQIKLMDFAIAKPMTASSETSQGIVVGTMQYLAPEQLQGGAVDARSDLYSFGAVMYELLSGTRTFPEKNLARLVTDKLSNRFQPLDKFKVQVPPRLRRLVHRCLLYQKERRVQSATELLRELEAIHRSVTEETPEQALKSYVKYSDDTRTVLDTRWVVPRLALVIPVLAFAALVVAGLYVFVSVRRAQNAVPETSPAAVIQPAPSPPGRDTSRAEDVQWETVAGAPPAGAQPAAVVDTPGSTATRATPGWTRELEEFVSATPAQPRPAPAPRPGPAPAVTRPETPAEPAAPPVPEPPPDEDLLTRLSRQRGTGDIVALMEGELAAKQYGNVQELWAKAPSEVARSTKAQILRMRAFQGADDSKGLESFLLTQEIGDAEFYLAKAYYFHGTRKPDQAQLYYEKSMRVPGQFLNFTALEQRRMLCRAEVATLACQMDPTEAKKKAAMDSWYEIKLRLQNAPDHKLYQRADAEIRRMSQ